MHVFSNGGRRARGRRLTRTGGHLGYQAEPWASRPHPQRRWRASLSHWLLPHRRGVASDPAIKALLPGPSLQSAADPSVE
ncbi:unnamed protein product [Knipowitschia caucasica]